MKLLSTLICLAIAWFVPAILAVAPSCSPSTISVTLGTNTSANATLASVSCTDATVGHVISYDVSNTTNGYTYFAMNDSDLILANRLDVEFGQTTWSVLVLAIDNDATPNTGTVTISLTTYESTTTTTTTPAPPGYSWFDEDENVMLFGATAAVVALTFATCILLCWRFHRTGTCLPKSCPEYRDCRASYSRNITCCPVPCDFGPEPDLDEETEAKLTAPEQQDTFGIYSTGDETAQKTTAVTDRKTTSRKKSRAQQKPKSRPKEKSIQEEEEDPPERKFVVSPVVVGNVNLQDVGFDGMRSPGFNAPMFTNYGGKNKPPMKRY